MLNTRATMRRFLLVLIGCVMLSAASGAFAQTQPAPGHEGPPRGGGSVNAGGSGPGGTRKPTCDGCPLPPAASRGGASLQGLVDTYKSDALQWTTQILNYATDLFWILAGIEFAWAAALLLLEQRELEGWIAAFLKKLMGISFFYALLLNSPKWINAIIDSFTEIGQNVGGTAGMSPDTILQQGVSLGIQVITSGASIGNVFVSALTGSFAYILLIGAIGCVIILCYIILAFTFVMALIEGYIVVSAGIILLGLGGSRWTQSYAERFLGGAVTSGVRMMVIFLLIGLSQSLATGNSSYSWTNLATAVGNAAGSLDYSGAAQQAFYLASSVIIFTALVLGLPKIVGGILNGSAGLGAGDMAGAMGAIGGGAAAAASMAARPYQMAAKLGGALAGSGGGGGGGAMSAMHAAGAASHAGSAGGSSMGGGGGSAASSIGKAASHVPPPHSGGARGGMSNGQVPPPRTSSLPSAGNASRGAGGHSASAQSAPVGPANKNGAAPPGRSSNGRSPSAPSASASPVAAGADAAAAVGAGDGASLSAMGGDAALSSGPVGDAPSSSASAGDVAPPSISSGEAPASFASAGSARQAPSGGAGGFTSASSSYVAAGHAPAAFVIPPPSPASTPAGGSQSGEKKRNSVEKFADKATSLQNWGSSMAQTMSSEIDSAPPAPTDS